jgi:peptide/nickel transport system substrate-binding protein/microcin C transport system substrate-binding protein
MREIRRFSLLMLLAWAALAWALPDTWTIGLETGVSTLNPFTLSGWDPYRASTYSLETLFEVDLINGGVTPVLATKYEVNKKAKKYTVYLRPGVEFHDGTPLTADDVKFTFDAYRDDRFEGAIWRPIWQGIESATVKAPLIIEFAVKKLEYDQFLGLLTQMRILPKSYYGKLEKSEWPGHMVGTGPYRLVKFVPNQRLEFDYFPKWWGGTPEKPPLVKHLILKTVADRHLAVDMMRKGELAFYPVSDIALYLELKKQNDPKIRLVGLEHLGGSSISISLNLTHPLFQSVNARKALVTLWNREALNTKVFGGVMEPAVDGFDQQALSYPPGKALPYDPAGARKLLESEGWKDDGTGVMAKVVDGKPTRFVLPMIIDHDENERWVTLYKEDARKAGIDVQIEKLASDNQTWHRLKEKKYVAWSFSGGSDRGISQLWHTGNFYNFYGFSDPKVDALLDKLNAEFDLKRRREINRQLFLQMRPQIVSLPGLYNPMTYFITSPQIAVDPVWPYHAQEWKAAGG